jgi:hypothetical protein
MSSMGQATATSLLRGVVGDFLKGGDAFSGVPRQQLETVAKGLTTEQLEELLRRYVSEHRAFAAAFAELDEKLSALPPDQRTSVAGLNLAASFNAAFASPIAQRRLVVPASGVLAGGSLAHRAAVLARELESRYQANPKLRPREQSEALRRAEAADLERVEADVQVEALRKKFNRAGLARPALEAAILAAVADSEAAARRKDEAMREAQQWSSVGLP